MSHTLIALAVVGSLLSPSTFGTVQKDKKFIVELRKVETREDTLECYKAKGKAAILFTVEETGELGEQFATACAIPVK